MAYNLASSWKLIFKKKSLQKNVMRLFLSPSVYASFLEWDCVQACHYLRTEKEGIYSK